MPPALRPTLGRLPALDLRGRAPSPDGRSGAAQGRRMSAPISLRRTGQAPLELGDGWRLVASASSHTPLPTSAELAEVSNRERKTAHNHHRLPLATRWHEVDLYRDDGPMRPEPHPAARMWVVAVRYRTTWPGEHGREWAFEALDQANAVGILTADDAPWFDFVAGFPPGATFAARQE